MSIKQALTWGGKAFFFLALPLNIIIGLNYLQGTIVPQSTLSFVYYITTLLGHYSLLIFLLYLIFFIPMALVFNAHGKAIRIWATILICLVSLIHLIDSFIFAQYRFHFNRFIFDLLFGGAASDIFDFSTNSILILTFSFVALVILLWWAGKKLEAKKTPIQFKLIITITVLNLLISNSIHIYADASGKRDITKIASMFPVYHATTSKRLMKKFGLTVDTIKLETEFNDFYYPHRPLECGKSNNPNILWIIIDSWRKDEFNKDVTPHLFSYAKDALIFNNHLSGSNNTRGAIFNLFYGLPSNYWDVSLQTKTSPVFIDELLKRKYHLGIFSSASLESPEFNQTVFSKVPNLRTETKALHAHTRDVKINEEWKLWLDTHIKTQKNYPFFGFLFYDSPHAYRYPQNYPITFLPNHTLNYLALNNNTDPVPVFNRHRNSVHFVDSLMKEVFQDLKRKNLFDNTIIIITGDHGQEFNDYKKNFWGHNSNFGMAQLHVPFIMFWPKSAPQEINRYTSHYDLVPTFVQTAWNCNNRPSDYSFGKSLLGQEERDAHLAASYLTYGILDLEKKLITVISPTGNYENLDFNLNDAPKDQMRKKLVFEIFQEMSRFHHKE